MSICHSLLLSSSLLFEGRKGMQASVAEEVSERLDRLGCRLGCRFGFFVSRCGRSGARGGRQLSDPSVPQSSFQSRSREDGSDSLVVMVTRAEDQLELPFPCTRCSGLRLRRLTVSLLRQVNRLLLSCTGVTLNPWKSMHLLIIVTDFVCICMCMRWSSLALSLLVNS